MSDPRLAPGIAAGRLSAEAAAANLSDLHPPYSPHEAAVAADRCYFCHDAPCMEACPTDIDIPLFIRQIAAGNDAGAAKTILSQNILGGMCARVCPTETLCEEACVRMTAEDKPVEIGRLQRHATDALMAADVHPFTRAAPTGKKVAVVGAGPAGLACAHRLAMHGHDVTVYEAKPKPGGLNEYGIAAYKTVDDFAQKEVAWLLKIGGIEIRHGQALGKDVTLEGLAEAHDAVFLGIGLGAVGGLGIPGEDLPGVRDAVDFIAELRQAEDPTKVPVGRNVVVIGGGMTAVDAAVQAKALGAENVTIAYRRSRADMPASGFEQELAAAKGVTIREHVMPVQAMGDAVVRSVAFRYAEAGPNGLEATGEGFSIPADMVLKAIGQKLVAPEGAALDGRKLAITGAGRTPNPKIWAGGDCAAGGEDLTVTAVAEGRDAAEDIHRALSA
ncbi:NAD(P)-dependent oxidoreductase [Rhodovulum sp. DZ06]|uniref:NAD(P)-dependent oxidoreductase n=1 Tax=Rhodovulum sp. DZ06 TaxID=3425126 RepID=UPI003D32EC3D